MADRVFGCQVGTGSIAFSRSRRLWQVAVAAACLAAAVVPILAMTSPPAHTSLMQNGMQAGATDTLVGCWRFSNGLAVRVNGDGTMAMGQLTGKWRLSDAAKRAYVLNWPEIQDNAVLSVDEKTLTETSPWFTLNATRMSGGSGIVGMWQWPGGALILTIRSDGTFSAGPISGRWQAANLGERTYTLTWPAPIHTGALAPDGQKFAGADQYGTPFAAGREACGDY